MRGGQKAKSQLRSSLEQLYIKAITDLSSPEAVAEQSSLTLETARSHKMVRHSLYNIVLSFSVCDTVVRCSLYDTLLSYSLVRHCLYDTLVRYSLYNTVDHTTFVMQ